jgi:uncharacterized protein YgbK (DUF1537 family)
MRRELDWSDRVMSGRLSKSATFAALLPPWPGDLRPQIRSTVTARPDHKLVVIDDDPTGTQTVYDVAVLTSWEEETLRAEFSGPGLCFYILTNSRSLPPEDARVLTLELAKNLRAAAGIMSFTLVSRSDSTLRGHFPLETDALAEVLGPFDATLLIPYFDAGGRYTIDNVHYTADGDTLVPTAETPFARDAAFGYRSSHLPTYAEEKSNGRIKAGEVQCVGLDELRRGGPDAITARLLALPRGSLVVINAAALADLDVFVAGLLSTEMQGRRFCFRTAAQFPAARLGLERRPLLTARALELTNKAASRVARRAPSRDYLPPGTVLPPPEKHRKPSGTSKAERDSASPALPNTGGLIMVGSYVPTTTRQLAYLTDDEDLLRIELRVDHLLSARRLQILDNVSKTIAKALSAGQDVMVFTSRPRVGGDSPAASLQISSRISEALVVLVRGLDVHPRYLLAKGGVTASDLATRALGVKRAMVLGQLVPGVPVWRLGLEAKFPGMTYIVFPGNVGGPDALAYALQALTPRQNV